MNLFQNTTFPLPAAQALNGTSVQVNYAGGTVNAIMLYESATSVAAILPSTSPLGTASVTVTYNGQVSAPSTIHVLQRVFGVFSINQTGFGLIASLNLVKSPTNSPDEAFCRFRKPHALAFPQLSISIGGLDGAGPSKEDRLTLRQMSN